MEWLRAHPYTSALVAVVILIAAGIFVIESRSPATILSSANATWSGGVPSSPYKSGSAPQSPQEIAQDVIQNQAPAKLTLPPLATSSGSFQSTSGTFDYESLLTQLSTPPSRTSASVQTGSSNNAITEAYQFIPTGLVATAAPSTKKMSAGQQALYEYGNEVGGEILSFESLHTDEAEVLKNQAEDRTDPTKAAALVSLGQGLASVGTFMQQMQDTPTSVTALHSSLAQSYLDIGAKLQLVAQAQTDANFVQAVENYDNAANTFVHNYGALAQYFSEQGVTFSSSDPGSVFSFTDASARGGL